MSTVELARRGAGCQILLNAPEKRNALSGEMWDELAARLEEAAAMQPAFLVITGAGKSFCAGGDLRAMQKELAAPDGPETFRKRIGDCFNALTSFPATTVASINGAAVGGGLEIAVACDLRIGTTDMIFRMPAVRFGMVMALPELQRLTAVVGWSWARAIALTGIEIDADTASRIGLAHEIVAPSELEQLTEKFIDMITGLEPEAARWTRLATDALIPPLPDAAELEDFEVGCFRRDEFWSRIGRPA